METQPLQPTSLLLHTTEHRHNFLTVPNHHLAPRRQERTLKHTKQLFLHELKLASKRLVFHFVRKTPLMLLLQH